MRSIAFEEWMQHHDIKPGQNSLFALVDSVNGNIMTVSKENDFQEMFKNLKEISQDDTIIEDDFELIEIWNAALGNE